MRAGGRQRRRPAQCRHRRADARRGDDVWPGRHRCGIPGNGPAGASHRHPVRAAPRRASADGAGAIPGRFAVSNALATLATGHLLGYDIDALLGALEELPAIPGRFQTYQTPSGVSVVVDYAHSVDSLEKVLATIRAFAGRRVLTVFG
ncbi:cyanophycin synthetase, partial [Nonomuraea sp. NPDC049784]|uniref:glutamate ligase domain-containing protein n=1 Tax=Nonomuraea sp. NPDC049784 TaxID=3154361 RepID=UPI0033E65AFC